MTREPIFTFTDTTSTGVKDVTVGGTILVLNDGTNKARILILSDRGTIDSTGEDPTIQDLLDGSFGLKYINAVVEGFIDEYGGREWDKDKIYLKGDLVTRNGSAFVALEKGSGNTPPSKQWSSEILDFKVINDLMTPSSKDALSAGQGKVLQDTKVGFSNYSSSDIPGVIKTRFDTATGTLYISTIDGIDA